MASSHITSWQIEGENVETMTDFIFLGSKVTADGDYSHEIKRCLEEKLLGRKESLEEKYDKFRQCIKKQRRRFADKGVYSQSYDFSQ